MNEQALSWVKMGCFSDFIKYYEKGVDQYKNNNGGGYKGQLENDKPGIYLWVENVNDIDENGETIFKGECTNYIGKSTTSVLQRNIEHYFCMAGAQYPIPEIYFKNKKRFSNSFSRKETRDILDDCDLMKTTVEASFRYMKNLGLYFAFPSPENTGKKPLAQIESDLLFQLCPLETRYSTLSNSEKDFTFRHLDALGNTQVNKFRDNSRKYAKMKGVKRPWNKMGNDPSRSY